MLSCGNMMVVLYFAKKKQKKVPQTIVVCNTLTVLGYPDSNQERQDQNLQCYHYTIPQCLNCGCKGTAFF